VGTERPALCVCMADAKAQNSQRNEDHALHRNSPIYRQGRDARASMSQHMAHPAQTIIWFFVIGLMRLLVEWSVSANPSAPPAPLSPSQTRRGLPHPMTATRRLATGQAAPRRPQRPGHSRMSRRGEDRQNSDASLPEPRQEQLQREQIEHQRIPAPDDKAAAHRVQTFHYTRTPFFVCHCIGNTDLSVDVAFGVGHAGCPSGPRRAHVPGKPCRHVGIGLGVVR
jgi:hypothetical protein